jgi:hypothetical protein
MKHFKECSARAIPDNAIDNEENSIPPVDALDTPTSSVTRDSTTVMQPILLLLPMMVVLLLSM